jgi:hypothetical protein
MILTIETLCVVLAVAVGLTVAHAVLVLALFLRPRREPAGAGRAAGPAKQPAGATGRRVSDALQEAFRTPLV